MLDYYYKIEDNNICEFKIKKRGEKSGYCSSKIWRDIIS